MLELNGTDLRREPIEVRKATLASILRKSRSGVRLNEHLEHPEGAVVFSHACKMGLEGDRFEAAGITLPIGPIAGQAQVQKSGGACAKAGGGGRLGQIISRGTILGRPVGHARVLVGECEAGLDSMRRGSPRAWRLVIERMVGAK
jgi:hypothetical protein